ncbi:hypothetical protein M413DRAFT_32596 [Hebeloma cylindrosporum]|uniref:HNH nuclease domain-containing protein n=1 Tax=Hebeloma cylindrosporum TaxID=76867 RepID=A0A0C3BT83_HEBCY|nr:hypothetical protein M413DRAFT_32596 [Hebeloma cylindrosporum h7]
MTLLPLEVPERLRDIAKVVNTYSTCLGIEKSLQLAIDGGDDVGNKHIYIRILGYTIHYVPTEKGLNTVVDEISSCVDDSAILEVGKLYYNHYIRAFRLRAKRSRTPTPHNDESPSSFHTVIEMNNHTFVDVPQSHADAQKNALIRDQYRCVVTGIYDHPSVKLNRELIRLLDSDHILQTAHTQCTHILYDPSNTMDPGSANPEFATTMWGIMHCFGYDSLPDELSGPKIHRLENVMTLAPQIHTKFERLELWLVATDEVNKYMLDAAHSFTLRGCPEYVTFATTDEVKLPVPSPTYLAIHAACAKVVHLSGAAEYIDKLDRDMERCMTLDPDGASASLLEYAIFELEARE